MRKTAIVDRTVTAFLLGVLISSCAIAMPGLEVNRAARVGADHGGMGQTRTPIRLPVGARLLENLSYGADSKQRLDVYIPAHATHAPVIFMVHGGAWMIGDKANAGVVQNKIDYFLPKGYIFISTAYRTIPEVGILDEAEDVAHALAYAQRRAAEWGGDASHFVMMGHSAGAHLVTLLSAAPSIWRKAGVAPWLGTIALDSAAYNVVDIMSSPHQRLYDRVFGQHRSLWEQISPTLRLERAPSPMLLVCSSVRRDSCDQARAFAEKAKSLGGRVNVLPVPLHHRDINVDVGVTASYTRNIDLFLHSLGTD